MQIKDSRYGQTSKVLTSVATACYHCVKNPVALNQRFVLSFLKRQRSLLSVQVCSRSEDSNRQAQKQERWEPLSRFCLVNICSDARSAQRQPQSQRCCIVFQIKQENPLVPTNPALALCCAIILLGSQLIWHPLHIHSNLQKVLN